MSTPTQWGTEFLVNTNTTGGHNDSVVTALADGRFVVAWADDSMTGPDKTAEAVRGQIFNADGSKDGAEFAINTDPSDFAGNQTPNAIVALADGGFMVAWDDNSGFGGDPHFGTVGQIFHADGTISGTPFLLNPTTGHDQSHPALTQLADGNIVATWTDFDPAVPSITGQLFHPDGTKLGSAFSVNATLAFTDLSTVTALAGGGFVVTWSDISGTLGDNDKFAIHAQMFNADGSKSDAEFLVNTTTTRSQYGSHVTALADGGFVVTYQDRSLSADDPSGIAVRAQVFDANGAKAGAEFLVNTTITGDESFPDIAALHDGRFVIAWTDVGQNPSDATIRAQIVNPDGTRSGAEFVVNTTTSGHQEAPHISVLADGRFVISWDDGSHSADDPSGFAIRAQIFDPRETGVTIDDSHDSGGGNDMLIGSPGDDTVVLGHKLNDYTVEHFGAKTMVIGAEGTDTLLSIEHLQFTDATLTPGNDSNPLFDSSYYLSRNADVFHAGANPFDHFNVDGWHEGRDPNPFFDTSAYLAVNKDVAANGTNPLDHYDQTGWHEGRDPSASFDTKLYLLHNPDVAAAGVDPLTHYLQYGMAEGRQAYQAVGHADAGFDAEYYLMHNPDVAASGMDPLQHFNQYGWHEGRNPNAWFDTAGYLAHYQDVAAAGINPLQHYEQNGWLEGRDPSAGFDTLKYLAANPDVAAAHVNPLDHFINNGIYEGRAAINDGIWH